MILAITAWCFLNCICDVQEWQKISQGAGFNLVSTSDYSGKGKDMQLVANKLSALALLGSSVALLDLIMLIPSAL